jgi:hypothetical protein
MSCISKRARNIGCTRATMSRDRVLLMFFYMILEKHVCNVMSHDLLLALAVVSFAHLIASTHSSDIIFLVSVRIRGLSDFVRRIITQRNDSCMIVMNCCILNCDELHVKSCQEYCLHLSVNVARQGAGDVFLYAFRKTCM